MIIQYLYTSFWMGMQSDQVIARGYNRGKNYTKMLCPGRGAGAKAHMPSRNPLKILAFHIFKKNFSARLDTALLLWYHLARSKHSDSAV